MGYRETESNSSSQGHSKSRSPTNPCNRKTTTITNSRKQRKEGILQKEEVRSVQPVRERLTEKDTEIHRRQRQRRKTGGKDKEDETKRREEKERKDGHTHRERDGLPTLWLCSLCAWFVASRCGYKTGEKLTSCSAPPRATSSGFCSSFPPPCYKCPL